MAIAASGSISVGSPEHDEGIQANLYRSLYGQFSLDETEVRSLAGVVSGPISFSDFRGKGSLKDFRRITTEAVHYQQTTSTSMAHLVDFYRYGYGHSSGPYGSAYGTILTDSDSKIYSGKEIRELYWTEQRLLGALSYVSRKVHLVIEGNCPNTSSSFGYMKIGSINFMRHDAAFSYDGTNSTWTWGYATLSPNNHDANNNPFGGDGNIVQVYFL